MNLQFISAHENNQPGSKDRFRTGAKRLLSAVYYRQLKAVASLLF